MFGWCRSHQTRRMILHSKETVQGTERGLTLEPHSINGGMSPKEESGSQEGKNRETEGEKNQCHDSSDTKKDFRELFKNQYLTFVFTYIP